MDKILDMLIIPDEILIFGFLLYYTYLQMFRHPDDRKENK